MRAIVVQEDQSLRWQEVPDPVPSEEEVVLRVRATAVNRADLLQRRGQYPPPPGAPPWLGLEASGTVEQVPARAGRRKWRLGDTACCLLAGGGYAERVAVHRDLLLPVPPRLSLEEAASLPEAWATAYLNLILEAGLRGGETVLIHAGASGVGTAAVQLCHSLHARVIATVGSAAKAEQVRALGADHVINYREEDVTEGLRRILSTIRSGEPGGLDVALDCLGGEELAAHLPLMNVGGRWVVIGLMKGRNTPLDLRPLLSKRLRLIGSTLRGRTVSEKSGVLAGLEEDVWPLFDRAEVQPVVHTVLPIARVEEAHALMERNENVGKIVLVVGEQSRG